MKPLIVAIGNSHLDAVRAASLAEDAPVQLEYLRFMTKEYHPHSISEDGRRRPVRRFLDDATALIERTRPAGVICFAASIMAFVVGSSDRPRRFDFVLPSRPDLPLTPCELVPYDLMLDYALSAAREWGEFIACAVATGLPVWVPCPPPPIETFEPFMAKLAPNVKANLTAYGVAPDAFRYKMWLLQAEADQQVAEELGATFLPAPVGTMGPSGLRSTDYAWDALHGNGAYGRLVLQQVADVITEDRHAPV